MGSVEKGRSWEGGLDIFKELCVGKSIDVPKSKGPLNSSRGTDNRQGDHVHQRSLVTSEHHYGGVDSVNQAHHVLSRAHEAIDNLTLRA